MPELLANGQRFHVQRLFPREPGEVVVFLHGLVIDNLSSFYCTLANPLVQAGAEMLLFDMRGHGLSSKPRTGYTIPEFSDDLIALLDKLEIDRPVHLVANSFGGLVAIRTAIAYPERVASLALVEGLYGEGWIELCVNSLTLTGLNFKLDRITERMAATGQRKLSRLCSSAADLLNNTSLIEDLAQTDPSDVDLRRVGCPILAVYGELSDLLSGVQAAAEVMPNIKLETFPGHGHMVLQDASATVLALMTDWLEAWAPERAFR